MNIHSRYKKATALSKLIAFFIMLSTISMPAYSQPDRPNLNAPVLTTHPGGDLWRHVRQRDAGFEGVSQVHGVDSGILINPQGEPWTRFRVGNLVQYGMIFLASVALLLALFYALRGRIYIEGGYSGKMVLRFNQFQRVVHWVLAILFLLLAVTGLILLFGRSLLIPVLGKEVFSVLASASKEAHNLFGPIFSASLLFMLIGFVKHNIYEKGDITWMLRAGGVLGKSHLSVGFFNMGEKFWFWSLILIGFVVSASGLVLVSPSLGQGRLIMELSHVVHSIGAIVLIGFSFGHMYLATLGMEGAREGMNNGYVDINWAEAHHDRWAKKCRESGGVISAAEYARLQGDGDPGLIPDQPQNTGGGTS